MNELEEAIAKLEMLLNEHHNTLSCIQGLKNVTESVKKHLEGQLEKARMEEQREFVRNYFASFHEKEYELEDFAEDVHEMEEAYGWEPEQCAELVYKFQKLQKILVCELQIGG